MAEEVLRPSQSIRVMSILSVYPNTLPGQSSIKQLTSICEHSFAKN